MLLRKRPGVEAHQLVCAASCPLSSPFSFCQAQTCVHSFSYANNCGVCRDPVAVEAAGEPENERLDRLVNTDFFSFSLPIATSPTHSYHLIDTQA